METLILIILGAFIGYAISSRGYKKHLDIIMGIMGALASSAIIGSINTPLEINGVFMLLMIEAGALLVVYIARFLDNLQVTFLNKLS
jgi:uncharacterized membrane protein YeaQ/YmgE (transglycosylase-associated protein family)